MMGRLHNKLLGSIASWKRKEYKEGYSILLTMPADLPMMAYLILNFLKKINLTKCNEILISLDASKNKVSPLIDVTRLDVPIRIVKPNTILKVLCRLTRSPFKYHWLQVISGLNAAESKWVLLKGCNYYVSDSSFYVRYFKKVDKSDAILYGTELRLIRHLRNPPVGTLELFINQKIKKKTIPIQLLARSEGDANYDNLNYVQKELKQDEVQILSHRPKKIHFYYLVGSYRSELKEGSKKDPLLRIFFLSLMNELLKGTKWHMEEFISLEKYYREYHPELDTVFREEMDEYFKDIRWVVRRNKLDMDRTQRELNRIKEIVR